MKIVPDSLKIYTGICIVCTVILVSSSAAIFARAGSGQNYKSSGSGTGSSYKSSSSGSSYKSDYSGSSSYKSSSTSTYTNSSSGSSSYSGSSSAYVQKKYEEFSGGDTYSAVLKINRNGSVDVAETYQTDLASGQYGLIRFIDMKNMYNPLIITDAKCDKGYVSRDNYAFEFGYREKDKPPVGKQKFVVKYRMKGAVVSDGTDIKFQWRIEFRGYPNADSITIQFPTGTDTGTIQAVKISNSSDSFAEPENIEFSAKGSNVTFTPGRVSTSIVDISALLPVNSIDTAEVKRIISELPLDSNYPSIDEYYTKININSDKTVNREDFYSYSAGSPDLPLKMYYEASYQTRYYWKEGNKLNDKSVWNRVYLYKNSGILTGPSYYRYRSITIPYNRHSNGRRTANASYSMWGNYSNSEPLFFDLHISPADLAYTGKTRFEITLPQSVNRDKVIVRFYLFHNYENDISMKQVMLREIHIKPEWKGSTLTGEYIAGLYNRQFFIARIIVPAEAFTVPGTLKKWGILFLHNMIFSPAQMTVIILFPLVIIAVIVLVILSKRKKDRELAALPPYVTFDNAGVEAIKSEDMAFDPQLFTDKAVQVVSTLQKAWSDGDMNAVRNFVSQGVYNRFRIQLKLMRELEKTVNITDGYKTSIIHLFPPSLSASYHTLHISMGASIRDITLPVDMPESYMRKELKRVKETYFSEVYSFTRRRGVKTDTSKNILAGQCPSCGYIPEKFNDTNKCSGCGTIYNSGEFDWVLSEISQSEEWNSMSMTEVQGLSELETSNISINRGIIEDRASALFWQWFASQAYGDRFLIIRDATERFLTAYSVPAKQYMAQGSVGSVDLKKVTLNNSTVMAEVLIKWSASFSPGAEPEHRESILTIVLPHDLKNPYGFADHSCNNCGAPLPENDSVKCSYCGEVLQKTNSDWLLEGIN